MRDLMFYYPVIRALEDGAVIRKAIRIALQVIGVLTVIGGLYLVIKLLKFAFQTNLAEATIGGLLFAALLTAATACVFQIYFYRAESIEQLPQSPFTVIPVFSLLLRTVGEAWATFGAFVGLGGCLFIWLVRESPRALLSSVPFGFPSVGVDTSFLGGLMFLVSTAAFSFGVLIVFYFLAELVLVTVDIAVNVRRLAAPPGAEVAAHPAAPAAVTVCPKCRAELESGAQFCGMCGFRMVQ